MLANVVSKVLVVSDGAGEGEGFHATMWPAILKPCWFSHRVVYILSGAFSGPCSKRICGIFNLGVGGVSAPDSF